MSSDRRSDAQWLQSERYAKLRASKERTRRARVKRIAKKLALRYERQRDDIELAKRQGLERRQPLKRKRQTEKPKCKPIIAYDLETTSIREGTPAPLYLTAYGKTGHFVFSGAIVERTPSDALRRLAFLLEGNFLVSEHAGCRFVAWYGNNFDAYFIAAAIIEHLPQFTLRPYMTRGHTLRGLLVTHNETHEEWEFLDAHAMILGGVAQTLKKFLETFAPEYGKLEAPDFDKVDFDPKNPKHVAYAERDSEGLYHGVMRAQQILLDTFSIPLQPTIGKAGIRTFQEHMPDGVVVYDPPWSAIRILRDHIMRGGYCHSVRMHVGPVWKYDLNQAYAAAMRESLLPAGRCYKTKGISKYAQAACYLVRARNPRNLVPMYVTDYETGEKIMALEQFHAWITSQELSQLQSEPGWTIEVEQGFAWDETFTMTDYVNKLERLRLNAPGGPKGAVGTMVKQIGNNSYGKTVEILEGLELVMAKQRPEGFTDFQAPDEDCQHLWFRFAPPEIRAYHKPQIGAFITAHVRMVVRRAVLRAPSAWIYADTDCVVFTEPVELPISATKYGLWKVEANGDEYIFLAKKVYCRRDGSEMKAKGLNVRRLSVSDYERWLTGTVPTQTQKQRQNFTKAMSGSEMFVQRDRCGTRLKSVTLKTATTKV